MDEKQTLVIKQGIILFFFISINEKAQISFFSNKKDKGGLKHQ